MVTSLAEPNRPFFLKYINAYVRVCQGCRTAMKPEGTIPYPPDDIMLGRVEKREFRNATGVKMLKETTSYCHLNLACVQAVCPTFVPSTLVIPSDVRKKLMCGFFRRHWATNLKNFKV